MTTRNAQHQSKTKPSATSASTATLQRACACGQHTVAGGECAACRKKREATLQRAAMSSPLVSDVPPIVQNVLHSPGQPLDAATRAFMEPRFGHDFSGVRVHADAQAATSAEVVNALAYTVGNHISFGASSYQPHSMDGRRLLAHELTHVMQQSHNAGGYAANERQLEADAERAATAITSHDQQPMLTGWARPRLQRQPRGGQRTPPAPTAPNARQQRVIDSARRTAAIRCQTTLFRVSGIVAPGPRGAPDASTEAQMRARALAQVMFEWDNPNMEQVGDVIGSIVHFLTPGVPVVVGPASDPECGTRAAYVRGLRPPIVLCPAFFSDTPEQQIRTMIHEAAHLARIGSADLGESYCVDFDCKTSCGGFESADSWAHFIHCLSGQAADQPMTIQGRPPPKSPGQPPQRGSGGRP